jgi:hypothetical protein
VTPNNKKRLALDIDRNIHSELKQLASQYNLSITKLVLQLIVERIARQKMIDPGE